MNAISRVGVDLAKQVMQVHAVDLTGKVVTNRALARSKFIEWCAHLPAGCLPAAWWRWRRAPAHTIGAVS